MNKDGQTYNIKPLTEHNVNSVTDYLIHTGEMVKYDDVTEFVQELLPKNITIDLRGKFGCVLHKREYQFWMVNKRHHLHIIEYGFKNVLVVFK
jgi:hypothetical protein